MPQQTHLPDVWAEARALRDRGDLDSARAILEDNLDTGTFQYGEDHPDVLATAHLLATMHRRAADLTSARRVLEEALHAGSLRLPDDDQIMLGLSFELARVADELGNRHEARRQYTRVATYGRGVPGFAEPVREALSWLGPAATAPAASAAPPPPPSWPMEHAGPVAPPMAAPTAYEPPPHYDDEPLPPMSAPLRFPPQQRAEDTDFVRYVPEAVPAAVPVPVFQTQPTVVVERRGRGPMIAAIGAAVTAVVAAAVAVAVMLGGGATPAAAPSTEPTSATELLPPSNVKLIDNGSEITITWTDPKTANGFAVMMGQSPQTLRLATQNLGLVTSHTVNGLNTKFNYCFQVIAIYQASDQPPRSETACTKRAAAS